MIASRGDIFAVPSTSSRIDEELYAIPPVDGVASGAVSTPQFGPHNTHSTDSHSPRSLTPGGRTSRASTTSSRRWFRDLKLSFFSRWQKKL